MAVIYWLSPGGVLPPADPAATFPNLFPKPKYAVINATLGGVATGLP